MELKRTSPSLAQFCLCCLNTDCTLYPEDKYNLGEAYKNLIGKSLQYKMPYDKQFCTECAQRLINCNKFREKSLRAYNLLSILSSKHDLLTTQNVRRINRSKNYLTSNITKKMFEPDHCDYSYLVQDRPLQVKMELKTKEDNGDIEIIIEPKKELADIKSDDEFLNDDIDNDTEFLYSDNKLANEEGIKNNLFNDRCETDEFCGGDSNADSDMELVCIGDVQDIDAPKRKRKDTPKNDAGHNYDTFNTVVNTVQEDLKAFRITKLNHKEQLADIQRRKKSDNYKNSPHKCRVCYKGFGTMSTYESHMKRHSDIFGPAECPICKMYFKTESLLRHHINQSHSMRFSCKSCPLVTNHKNSAVNHGRWHKGLKFKCQHCDEEYSKKTTYLSHLRIRHPSDVVCTMCGFSFITEKGLKMHINFKHHFDYVEKPDGPACEACNVRFATDVAYKAHLSVSPKHTYPVKRNEPVVKRTGRSAICKTQLVECEQRFHPEKNQTQFPPQFPKPLLCELCGKSFKMACFLRDHVLTAHAASKPEYQCNKCNKKYSQRSNLIVHLKSHTGAQPSFGCPTCGKKFSNKANMKRHILTHKVLKPFKCHACDKTFVNASERRYHVLHSHLKKPWPKKNRGPRVRASRSRNTTEAVCGIAIPEQNRATSKGDDSQE
ncbi:zinc finger protein 699-like isoform X3 [Pararge aegeria]|uniref:zinc finger protein 699-like isoform X3 n=1 Tax=Pararge aegeria TaxID=116150 RepID=UPI0019D0CD59|nr:zinc finger protein 699-like isoform X3 [Pararge aegeria]